MLKECRSHGWSRKRSCSRDRSLDVATKSTATNVEKKIEGRKLRNGKVVIVGNDV